MINPRLVRENPEFLRQAWLRRGLEAPVDRLVELDESRRSLISVVESAKAAKNAASAEVGKLKREGKDASAAIAAIKERGDEQVEAEAKLVAAEKELEEILMGLPNLPHASVPQGRSSEDNVVARSWGEIKEAPSWAKDHLQVGEALKLFDFKRGAKVREPAFRSTPAGALVWNAP